MHRMMLPLFLTFVLWGGLAFAPAARAAKTTPSPDFDEPSSKADDTVTRDKEKIDTIDIATPPGPVGEEPERHLEYFYPFRNALFVRAGMNQTSKVADDGKQSHLMAGVQYFHTFPNFQSWDLGADLIGDGTGELHGQFRQVYSRSKFRPYTKYGAGLRMDPKDKMVGFLQYKNYQIRGAVGVEQFARDRMSLRAEIEAAFSLNAFQVRASGGLVWAW